MENTGEKILIIDDAEDLRETMSEILEIKGYNATTASNGIEGVDMAVEQHPDLILLDLRMPDIDGFEVIRRIRNHDDKWGETAKILILTASGESDEIPDDIGFSPVDFLLKTEYGIDNIAGRIEEKLNENTN